MIKLIELETCASTNDEAWTHANMQVNTPHLMAPHLVVAEKQTSGRGRQGRQWSSEHTGNFYGSLLCAAPSRHTSWVPLAAGVAALETLATLVGEKKCTALRLKWPNDLICDIADTPAKIGGILCESKIIGGTTYAVVIGLGLNLKTAPQIDGMNTAALEEHLHIEISKKDFGIYWAERCLDYIKQLTENETQSLARQWLRWAKLEQYPKFATHSGDGSLRTVRATGLDNAGRLLVESNGVVEAIDQAN